ncbi:MAG: 3-oxoacyl-ACP reductase [Chloroflexi bacterium]|nr:3-oxoacyl-ACP reductase [Chloroflexota bacterium]
MSFENKLAIVTGSYQGLGKGIAKEFAKNGSNLILVDRDEKLKTTQEELKEYGNTVEIIIGDVSQESTAKSVMNIVETKFTGLDILVNNAGIGGINKTLWELPSEEFDRVYSINLKSVFLFCKYAVPLMLKNNYGRIVNIASIAGKEGNPNASAYSATKAGVIGLTKSLGKELSKTEIRVNCITPAVVNTSILDEFTEEHINYMIEKIPIGRTGEIEEVANMVSWLSSEKCSFSTGAVFDISGGRATY